MAGGAGRVADGGGKAVVGNGDDPGGMAPAAAVEQVDQCGALVLRHGQGGHGDGLVALADDETAGRDGVEGRQPVTWNTSVLECFAFNLMCRTLLSRPSDLRIYVGDMSSTKSEAMAGRGSARVDPRACTTRSALGSGAAVVLKNERGADYCLPEDSRSRHGRRGGGYGIPQRMHVGQYIRL